MGTTREQRVEEARIGAVVEQMLRGYGPQEGETVSFDATLGTEAPGDWTRFEDIPIEASDIPKAKRIVDDLLSQD